MRTAAFRITFLTPAFLGDAEQNGRWRTPPFKAQLRQWWRVAYAAAHGFNVDVGKMREEEGKLFGNAWLSHQENQRIIHDHCKSKVRLRLDCWEKGRLGSWGGLEQEPVSHPEVTKTDYRVGPHGYLGYGPLDARGGTKLAKGNAAIHAGESATLSLAFPEEHTGLIRQAFRLMHQYGTVGGRSRNGWGSFELTPLDETPSLQGSIPQRPWRECLDRDWPHAIGTDEKGPLIWQTAEHDDWKSLMRTLAIIRIGLRTQFKLYLKKEAGDKEIARNGKRVGISHGQPQDRHWLSYPVTNHDVAGWKNLRLPNSLRFKVRKADSGRLVGVIFHMPCLPPAAFKPNRKTLEIVWTCVHKFLDQLCERKNPLCDSADRHALRQQAAQLAGIGLQRISE